MQQRTLGKTGFQVSALTLGGGGIGMVWGPTTDEECVETVKYAVASGINLLDLAPVYGTGKSEEIVGKRGESSPPHHLSRPRCLSCRMSARISPARSSGPSQAVSAVCRWPPGNGPTRHQYLVLRRGDGRTR